MLKYNTWRKIYNIIAIGKDGGQVRNLSVQKASQISHFLITRQQFFNSGIQCSNMKISKDNVHSQTLSKLQIYSM